MRATFLHSAEADQELEKSNGPFWDALLARIRSDGFEHHPTTVLDVGSHLGGLLGRVVSLWGARTLYGIEPIPNLRKRALLRLQSQTDSVHMLSPEQWSSIPSRSVDLALAVESLQFIESLDSFFEEVERVLGESGRAYFVLGCHADNPAWRSWKFQLENMGHRVFTHVPMNILAAGAGRNLLPCVRALRSDGWITHDPREPTFAFESVHQMFDHHFRHKLLFRFTRR